MSAIISSWELKKTHLAIRLWTAELISMEADGHLHTYQWLTPTHVAGLDVQWAADLLGEHMAQGRLLCWLRDTFACVH
jgi:hypothetical protein